MVLGSLKYKVLPQPMKHITMLYFMIIKKKEYFNFGFKVQNVQNEIKSSLFKCQNIIRIWSSKSLWWETLTHPSYNSSVNR